MLWTRPYWSMETTAAQARRHWREGKPSLKKLAYEKSPTAGDLRDVDVRLARARELYESAALTEDSLVHQPVTHPNVP